MYNFSSTVTATWLLRWYSQGVVVNRTVVLLSMNALPLVRWPTKCMDWDQRGVDTTPTTSFTAFKIASFLHCIKRSVRKVETRGAGNLLHINSERSLMFYHSLIHLNHRNNLVWSHTLCCWQHTPHVPHTQTLHQGNCGAELWGLGWSLEGLWYSVWGAPLQQGTVENTNQQWKLKIREFRAIRTIKLL